MLLCFVHFISIRAEKQILKLLSAALFISQLDFDVIEVTMAADC